MQKSINITCLDASASSSLEWEATDEIPDVWELDFGWTKTPFSPFDEGSFAAYQLAVEEYGKRLPSNACVILARYSSALSPLFSSTDTLERSYQGYLDHYHLTSTPWLYELYCANLFSDYLHRLAALLPEEATPCLYIDLADEEPLSKKILLFCARRFAHFKLLFSNQPLPVISSSGTIGVSLPADHLFSSETYDSLFKTLTDRGLAFQCIPEEMLNDFWDGIDHLIIDPKTMGESAQRMLYGFEAAGGEIVTMGGEIAPFETVSLESYLKISE